MTNNWTFFTAPQLSDSAFNMPLFMLYGFNLYQANQDVSLEDFTEQKKKAKLRLDSLKVKRSFFYHATNSRVVQYKEKKRFLPYCVDKCLSDTNENCN